MEHGILHFGIFTKPKLISGSALPPAKKASQYVYAHHCHNSIFSICCRWQIVKIVHLSCEPLAFILLNLSNKQVILFDGMAPRIVSLCSVETQLFPSDRSVGAAPAGRRVGGGSGGTLLSSGTAGTSGLSTRTQARGQSHTPAADIRYCKAFFS